MMLCIRDGAKRSLLLSSEKNKPDGSTGSPLLGFNRACNVENGSNAGAVILSPCARMPAVKMCSNEDNLIGILASRNFTDNLRNIYTLPDLCLEVKGYCHISLLHQSMDELYILAPYLSCGYFQHASIRGRGKRIFYPILVMTDRSGQQIPNKNALDSKLFQERHDLH